MAKTDNLPTYCDHCHNCVGWPLLFSAPVLGEYWCMRCMVNNGDQTVSYVHVLHQKRGRWSKNVKQCAPVLLTPEMVLNSRKQPVNR